MEPLALSFGAVLLMGLIFGAGPCNISCLPYLGPVFMAGEGNGRGAWRTVVPFSAGRLVSYSALGAVAGGVGHVATEWLASGPASLLLGGTTALVGLVLLRRAGHVAVCTGNTSSVAEQSIQFQPRRRRVLMPLGLFGMGTAMALNPCLPLGTVLLASAASASAITGLWLGLGFGVGAVLVPSLVFSIVVAHFGAQIRSHLLQWRTALERGAGGMLIMLGVMTAMGWVQP